MPLTPVKAAHRVNEQVTVEMQVKAAKQCAHCAQVFLDSEADHHDPANLAVAVSEAAKAGFKEAKVDDLAAHFQGKTIRVTGVVTLKDSRPQIRVDDPKQIEVVPSP